MTEIPNSGCGFAPGPVLRSLSAFTEQGLASERMDAVAGARVVCARYDLLVHDFPEMAGADRRAIDEWLLANVAFISRPQSAQAVTNTPIPIGPVEKEAYRPPRYCRAAILPAAGGDGLFDVKGCGIEPGDVPVLPNSNGLLTLREAFHELLFERLVDAALQHAGDDARPVPAYAVIDLGFDARWHDGRPDERAALLVRRAQTRPRFQWGKTDPGLDVARRLLGLELTLRRYGLTASSCGAVRFRLAEEAGGLRVTRDGRRLAFDEPALARLREASGFRGEERIVDGVNVQVAGDILEEPPRILDFGRYRLRAAFDTVLHSAWFADYESLRGDFVRPEDPAYVQPVPELSLAGLEDGSLYRGLGAALDAWTRGTGGCGEIAPALDGLVKRATFWPALNPPRPR